MLAETIEGIKRARFNSTVYPAAALGSRTRNVAVTVLWPLLYGLLYGILQMEDFALLLGACVLFALLAWSCWRPAASTGPASAPGKSQRRRLSLEPLEARSG